MIYFSLNDSIFSHFIIVLRKSDLVETKQQTKLPTLTAGANKGPKFSKNMASGNPHLWSPTDFGSDALWVGHAFHIFRYMLPLKMLAHSKLLAFHLLTHQIILQYILLDISDVAH